MNNDNLTPATIMDDLHTHTLPRRVLCYSTLSSTMDAAREQLQQQPADAFPMLIVSEQQTAGRGRMRRPWHAPPGSALLFSLAIKPQQLLPPAHAVRLTWLVGVSMCEAITSMTGVQARLKWPNDVVLPLNDDTPHRWGKVAGILQESGSSGDQLQWAVVGSGLNVHAAPDLPERLVFPATHLAAHATRPVARLAVLRAVLRRCDFWYPLLWHPDSDNSLFVAWRALLATRGRPVEITGDAGVVRGIAEDVTTDGALLVRATDGTLHTVTNGDIGG